MRNRRKGKRVGRDLRWGCRRRGSRRPVAAFLASVPIPSHWGFVQGNRTFFSLPLFVRCSFDIPWNRNFSDCVFDTTFLPWHINFNLKMILPYPAVYHEVEEVSIPIWDTNKFQFECPPSLSSKREWDVLVRRSFRNLASRAKTWNWKFLLRRGDGGMSLLTWSGVETHLLTAPLTIDGLRAIEMSSAFGSLASFYSLVISSENSSLSSDVLITGEKWKFY